MSRTPLLIINTGDGKGKTTAAVGQAVRAYGNNLRVVFAQFMKKPDAAGEQAVLAELLADDFLAGGAGFYRTKKEYPEHRQAAEQVLRWADAKLETHPDILILDEALYALAAELITPDEIITFVDKAAALGTHLVLTGRHLPEFLKARAHTVTEMLPVKHAFESAQPAQKGIEF